MEKWITLESETDVRASETLVLQASGAIGDNIWYLSAFRALAASDPSGRIDLITHVDTPVVPLFGNERIIYRYLSLILFSWGNGAKRRAARKKGPLSYAHYLADRFSQEFWSPWVVLQALRQGNYKRCFIFSRKKNLVWMAHLAKIPEIYSLTGMYWKKVPLEMRHTFFRRPDPGQISMLLDMWGIPPCLGSTVLHPNIAAVKEVEKLYAMYPKPWVVFGIGSASDRRIWPAERFASMADHFWDAGYRSIFLMGASHETPIAHTIRNYCQRARPIVVAHLSLEQAIALVSCCQFTFCNDSGIMNVSAAVGVKTYSLFSNVPPHTYSPHICPITPEGGVDPELRADSITLDDVMACFQREGLLKNRRAVM